jgi:hypothetical protein
LAVLDFTSLFKKSAYNNVLVLLMAFMNGSKTKQFSEKTLKYDNKIQTFWHVEGNKKLCVYSQNHFEN